MPRQLKRYHPKNSKYERKTLDKNGRRVVKPFKKTDYDEMQRILRTQMEKCDETSEEYFRLYRLKILLHIGVNTGLRITTLVELTPYDVADGEVTFTEHKTGKRMQYRMNEEVMKPIKDYIKWLGITQSEYLFPNSRENNFPINRSTAWRQIKALAKEAGVEYQIGCHSMRKSFGRWYYDATHDLLQTQQLLMHNSPLVTMAYICLEYGDIQAERAKINYGTKWE